MTPLLQNSSDASDRLNVKCGWTELPRNFAHYFEWYHSTDSRVLFLFTVWNEFIPSRLMLLTRFCRPNDIFWSVCWSFESLNIFSSNNYTHIVCTQWFFQNAVLFLSYTLMKPAWRPRGKGGPCQRVTRVTGGTNKSDFGWHSVSTVPYYIDNFYSKSITMFCLKLMLVIKGNVYLSLGLLYLRLNIG